MQLARQTAIIADIGQRLGNKRRGIVPVIVSVDAGVKRIGPHPGQKTGPAGRADRRLAVGVREGRARGREPVDVWRADMAVAQAGDRVVVCCLPRSISEVETFFS